MDKRSDEFIQKASYIHNYKYDYFLTVFKSSKNKIKIKCPIHGVFKQRASHHLAGHGCNECAAQVRGKKRSLNLKDFVDKANSIHKNNYDYSNVKYVNSHTNIEIICNIHGVFEQTPNGHLCGRGCQKCGIEKRTAAISLTRDEFIDKSNNVHNNYYDYSLVVYVNSHTNVKIICKKHDVFEQEPTNHLLGQGCPRCRGSISKREILWLDSCNVQNKYRQITMNVNGKKYKVDGYKPTINTIYEFNGDFWHGNPKIYKATDINPVMKMTYGELYQRTLKKEEDLKSVGYNVISIWESDFDNN